MRSPPPPEGRRLQPRGGEPASLSKAPALAPQGASLTANAQPSAAPTADGLGPTVMKLPKRTLPNTAAATQPSSSPAGSERGAVAPHAAPHTASLQHESLVDHRRSAHHTAALSAEHLGGRIPEQTRPVNPRRGVSPTRSTQTSVAASPLRNSVNQHAAHLARPSPQAQLGPQAAAMGSAKAAAQQQAQTLAATHAARQAPPAAVPRHGQGVSPMPPRTSSFSHAPAYPGPPCHGQVPSTQRAQSPGRPPGPALQPPGPMQQLAPAMSKLPGHGQQRHAVTPGPAAVGPPMAQGSMLEGMVSQRMQRANELAQRLAGGGAVKGGVGLGGLGLGAMQPPGSQVAVPPAAPVIAAGRQGSGILGTTEAAGAFGFGAGALGAPGMLPGSPQEPPLSQHTQHKYFFTTPGRPVCGGSGPPSSGLGQSGLGNTGLGGSFSGPQHGGVGHPADGFDHSGLYDAGDPFGLGLNTLHNLPPPPRSAPAAEGSSCDPVLGGALSCDMPNLSRDRSGLGGMPGGLQFSLTVLTSDSRWELLNFSPGEDLDQKGAAFLQQKGLKAAFQAGLVSKMRTMIQLGQAQSSVDIVDLI